MTIRQALPQYGYNLFESIDHSLFADCLVFCAPEAWYLTKTFFPIAPKAVAIPTSMEQSALEFQINKLPICETVFGIGGGSACDAAKMYSWINGAKLVLAPTILSVDAPYTKAIGVRINHRVRYIGEAFPQEFLIDFSLLQKAPAKLNRAGVGDVLSIFTALFDWRLAHLRTGEKYDEHLAAESQDLLDRLFAGADAIRDCTESGLRLLSELYIGEVRLCEKFGNSRPEEGSEHYFAYCLESITKKSYIHGELVAIGILLGGLYQEQNVTPIIDFLNQVKVQYRPNQVGISEDEIHQTLLYLPQYLSEEKHLLYGIFHHQGINKHQAENLIRKFYELI